MNIQCSADKGIMTHEECLACSLGLQHPPCGMDYSLLKSIYDVMSVREDIHVTDLVSCVRRAYYDKKIHTAEMPHLMLARYLGTTFHNSVAKNNDYSLAEYALEHEGVVGTTDRYYPEHKRLVDYKTAKKIYPHLLPYGSHEIQVNLYAHMLRQKGFDVESLAIQYISLTGPSTCSRCKVNMVMATENLIFDGDPGSLAVRCPNCGHTTRGANLGVYMVECRVYPDEEVETVFTYRKGLLDEALKSERPPVAEPGWLCKRYCPHLGICPEGQAHVGSDDE